jgi:hypothetical protein
VVTPATALLSLAAVGGGRVLAIGELQQQVGRHG